MFVVFDYNTLVSSRTLEIIWNRDSLDTEELLMGKRMVLYITIKRQLLWHTPFFHYTYYDEANLWHVCLHTLDIYIYNVCLLHGQIDQSYITCILYMYMYVYNTCIP